MGRLKIDVFCLESGVLLGSSLSCSISDTAGKVHGAMDIRDATPLRSCADGGRKVVMIAEFGLAKDVVPRFQLYDNSDRRLFEQEEQLLQQPVQSDISVLKESIIFITPPQPNAAKFLLNKYKIKLVSISDSNNIQGKASLVALKEVARPGLRKRQMSGSDSYEVFDNVKVKKNKLHENDMKKYLPTVPLPHKALSSIVPPLNRGRNVDASNNVEKSIKLEPIDEEETPRNLDAKSCSNIPFHDLSVVRTFTIPVTSGESLIMPTHIKTELD